MPRCYMVKKGSSQRHEAAPPRSPTEASVAPPCYSPALAEPRSAEYAVLGGVGGEAGGERGGAAGAGDMGGNGVVVAGRSAADTEAAHELLSLAQSLPPLPPAAVLTVLDPAPLLYTYTIQPTNIYILAEDSPTDSLYHAVQTVAPLETVDFDQINYVYSEHETEPVVEIIDQADFIESSPDYEEAVPNYVEMGSQSEQAQAEGEVVQELELELEIEIDPSTGSERNPNPERDVRLECDAKQQPNVKPRGDVKGQYDAKSKRDVKLKRDAKPKRDAEVELDVDVEGDFVPDLSPKPPTMGRDKPGKYDCKECGKRYATSSNLSRHKQTHRSLDSMSAKRCDKCGKAYVSMPALAMHVLTHRMGHVCGVCGKQFSRPWLLRGHLRSHTGEKPYSCASCGKSFADRSNLRAHLQTHSSDKKYECGRCRKTFALKSYLHKHQEATCVREDPDDD